MLGFKVCQTCKEIVTYTHNEEKHAVEIGSKKSYVSYLAEKDFKVTVWICLRDLKENDDIGNLSQLRKLLRNGNLETEILMKSSLNCFSNRLELSKERVYKF